MPTTLDEVLAPEFLDDIDSIPIEDLRARRTKCQEVEVQLSYIRRMAQGRLDILVADIRRRVDGSAKGDLGQLLDHLTPILAEGIRGKDRGALPTLMAPEITDELTNELDAALPESTLARLVHLDDDEVLGIGEQLRDLEKTVSNRRHQVHRQLDALTAELVRRYKDRPVEIDSLLQ
jgi:hypothetical protein